MQERGQTGEDQQVLISPLNAVAETVEIPETDTLPVQSMVKTILRSIGPGVRVGEEFTQGENPPCGLRTEWWRFRCERIL